MSRIDQALRRAAAQTPPGAAATEEPTPEPVAGADTEVLAREPFPVEISERVRKPEAIAAIPVPPVLADPLLAEPDPVLSVTASKQAGGPGMAGQENGRLFDRLDAKLSEKVVVDHNMAPVSREQYRRLAAVLHDAQASTGVRVVMIASAVPGEGKTLTATNLALTLSESYRNRVLLIDADLRKPTLHQVFRLQVSAGLIDGLDAPGDVKLVVRQVSSRLSVLPAGRPTSDPMAALTSSRMRRLIDEAKELFDWVILDTPPLTLLPDAHLLSSLVDGVVLVIRANATPHELVKRAVDVIGRKRIAGVVLNRADARVQPGYNDYSHGYYPAEGEGSTRP